MRSSLDTPTNISSVNTPQNLDSVRYGTTIIDGQSTSMQTPTMTYEDSDETYENQSRRKRLTLLALIVLTVGVISAIVGVTVSASNKSSDAKAINKNNLTFESVTPLEAGAPNTPSRPTTLSQETSVVVPNNAKHNASKLNKGTTKLQGTGNSTSTRDATSDSTQETAAALPYKDIDFDWKNINNWEWADGSAMNDAAAKFTRDGILVDRTVRATPLRTRKGWSGAKVVYFSWVSNDASDTNIWMLNTKIKTQFAANNGWPYYGELDIFEMFTQDAKDKPNYDFSGFGGFSSVKSYGQLTLHMAESVSSSTGCFCPASPSKSAWYENQFGATSGCTAQFKNVPNKKNGIAMVFGSDSNGKYLQVIQFPKLVKGKDGTYNVIEDAQSVVSQKIYNNENLFWGTKVSECHSQGFNPSTGFPFFEEFRLVFEEQDASKKGHFLVTDIKILMKT